MFNNTTIFSRFHKNCYICSPKHGKWRSWLARCVRDAEAGCSSHLFPTYRFSEHTGSGAVG